MTTSLIVSGISLVALILMVANKQRELNAGKALFSVGSSKTDTRIADMWSSMVYMITHVSVQSCKKFAKQAVLKTETFFIGQFERVAHRFSIVGDMVTGYDLPRNRGSVSFFLKNIEDHKRLVRKVPVDFRK